MHPRRPSTTLLLVAVLLLAALLAGCGGGEQSGNGSQEGESGGTKEQGGAVAKKEVTGAAKQGALRPKIALGTVTRVRPERRKMIIRATTAEGDLERMPFKVGRQATITLDDQAAEVADIQDGQQAQITYVVRGEINLARKVTLISGEG